MKLEKLFKKLNKKDFVLTDTVIYNNACTHTIFIFDNNIHIQNLASGDICKCKDIEKCISIFKRIDELSKIYNANEELDNQIKIKTIW